MQVKDVSADKAPPVVLVGNKADLEQLREVSTSEGIELAKTMDCDFFEASAKTRVNVQERCAFSLQIVANPHFPKPVSSS